MAQDASKVRVALTGRIIVTNLDTPEPVDSSNASLETLLAATGSADLGFTTEDGVTFNFAKSVEEIKGWQSLEPLRKIVTESPKSAQFVLRQLEKNTWLTTMGGTIKQGQLVDGKQEYMWEPDDSTTVQKKLYVVFDDGPIRFLFCFRRAEQSAEVEMQLVRSDAVNLPNEWSALASSKAGEKAMFMLTNDPSFAGAAAQEPTGAANLVEVTSVGADTYLLGEGPGVVDNGDGTVTLSGDNVTPNPDGVTFTITY